jgi:hypothetical protein
METEPYLVREHPTMENHYFNFGFGGDCGLFVHAATCFQAATVLFRLWQRSLRRWCSIHVSRHDLAPCGANFQWLRPWQ